ncbi:hypothetical protein [Fischerella thermalis]|nr:hypothetical protein [Fischerella thermalis]
MGKQISKTAVVRQRSGSSVPLIPAEATASLRTSAFLCKDICAIGHF